MERTQKAEEFELGRSDGGAGDMEFVGQRLAPVPVLGGGLLASVEGKFHVLVCRIRGFYIKIDEPSLFFFKSAPTMSQQQQFCQSHNQTEGQSIFFRPIQPDVNPQASSSSLTTLTKRRSADVSLPPLPVMDPKRTKTSHS